MGSMWCLRKTSWVGVRTKKSYPDFVGMFDALVDADVRWTPYSAADIGARAPQGLSSLCLRDQEFWMTRKPLVYDIHVEEYAVHRVLRQFNRYQESPLPVTHSVPQSVHSWTRQGQSAAMQWAPRVLPFAQQWAQALDDVVVEERPHSDEAFAAYLAWYLPRTRSRVLVVPQDTPRAPAQVTDMYPVSRDQNFAIATEALALVEAEVDQNLQRFMYMAPQEHGAAYQKIKEYCARFRRAISCRGGHADVYLPPRPQYPGPSSALPTRPQYPGSSSATPARPQYPGSSSGTPARPQYPGSSSSTPARPRAAYLGSSSGAPARPPYYTPWPAVPRFAPPNPDAAGTSSGGPLWNDFDYTGHGGVEEDVETGDDGSQPGGAWIGSLFSLHPYPDEIGPSQLGGAPPVPTQVSQEDVLTPVADEARRPTRQVAPPDPLTYS
ncbi:unnamed protein product [Urochloa humidicola]